MKRVLIIAYYWPPNAGVGTHRWLKFARYLPQHGWMPVVYTPANPEMQGSDPTLERQVPPEVEVIKAPINEPYRWYKRFTGMRRDTPLRTAFLREEAPPSWRENAANWVRSNLFIPDARVWWVRPSVKRLLRLLARQPVDVVVTTGSPHSLHLIGAELQRRTGTPWLADFRDPWTNIDYYGQLKLTRWADAMHRRMERDVLRQADAVTTVSWRWAQELAAIGQRGVDVITNGFDPNDLPEPPAAVDERWSLVHVGSITATRDAPLLWKALADRAARDTIFRERFTLRLVGGVDHRVRTSLREAGLDPYLEVIGHVEHAEALRHMQRARALLLPVNDTPNAMGFLPAKVFEYLAARRPILCLAPQGADIERVLGGTHTVVRRNDADMLHNAVEGLFRSETMPPPAPLEFTRQALTGRLADLLGRMTGG
jgi:glycosyltransferase involved in cell wall biosynthesis